MKVGNDDERGGSGFIKYFVMYNPALTLAGNGRISFYTLTDGAAKAFTGGLFHVPSTHWLKADVRKSSLDNSLQTFC